MPYTVRSRLLLLVLSLLVPALGAALWAVARSHSAERDAQSRHLLDTHRMLAHTIDSAFADGAGSAQRWLDELPLAADLTVALLDGQGQVLARRPAGSNPLPALPQLLPLLQQQAEARVVGPLFGAEPMVGYVSRSPHGRLNLTARPRSRIAGVPAAALPLGFAAIALLVSGVLGARHVADGLVRALGSFRQAAGRLQRGQTVEPDRRSGIAECDAVAQALADASQAVQRRAADAQHQAEQTAAGAAPGQNLQTLGRLTGHVAHDVNNLLGVIGNAMHLIALQDRGDARLDEAAAMVQRSVAAGSRLTHHLLRLAGPRPAAPRALDLAVFLPKAQDLIETLAGKRIDIQTSVARGVQPVYVDAAELELALLDLALDARDAMPSGGHLWLQACDADAADTAGLPPGPYVQISLTDDRNDGGRADRSGPGTETGATGPGPARAFCTRAGGTAQQAGTPGLGRCVTLVLPAAGAAQAAPMPAVIATASTSTRSPPTPPPSR